MWTLCAIGRPNNGISTAILDIDRQRITVVLLVTLQSLSALEIRIGRLPRIKMQGFPQKQQIMKMAIQTSPYLLYHGIELMRFEMEEVFLLTLYFCAGLPNIQQEKYDGDTPKKPTDTAP